MYLCFYVDDGLVFSTNDSIQIKFLKHLKEMFEVICQNPTTYVGIHITQDKKTGSITIDQQNYIHQTRFGMEDCKTKPLPLILGIDSVDMEGEDTDAARFPYREAVGCLDYLALMSRPDIALLQLSRMMISSLFSKVASVTRRSGFVVDLESFHQIVPYHGLYYLIRHISKSFMPNFCGRRPCRQFLRGTGIVSESELVLSVFQRGFEESLLVSC